MSRVLPSLNVACCWQSPKRLNFARFRTKMKNCKIDHPIVKQIDPIAFDSIRFKN